MKIIKKELTKTDRNGTKYFTVREVCPVCHGSGIVKEYVALNGGLCYTCGGCGYTEYETKEYTAEYEEKLAAQRAKRAEEKAIKEKTRKQEWVQEERKNFLKNNAFNENGDTFIFLGNTYEIKDKIKETGAKYDSFLGWHIDHEVEGFKMAKVEADDILECTDNSVEYSYKKCKELKQKAEEKQKENEPVSEWYGKKDDSVELTVKYVRRIEIKAKRAPSFVPANSYIHIFEDAEHRKFVWKTTLPVEAETGSIIKITAKIKGHEEYKGEKQTILIRCKIAHC